GLVKLVERGDHRQSTHQFGNEPELDQIFRFDFAEQLPYPALGLGTHRSRKADAGLLGAVADDLFEPVEGAAHNKQNVGRVDLDEVLVGVLAAALRRHRGHRAFDELEQSLLHAFAGHVARDRRVVGFARDFVDFVDVDDGALRLLDLVVAVLQQLLDDVFDVFAYVAGLGQCRGVGHDEGHIQHARQGLCEQRLARTGRPDEHDVALGQLDVVALDLAVTDALVVVVYRHRQHALGQALANDVLVEERLDFGRRGQLGPYGRTRTGLRFFADDVIAEVDALVANEHRWPRDQLADFVLAFIAERAMQHLCVGRSLLVRHMCFVSLVRIWRPGPGRHIQRLLGRDGTALPAGLPRPSSRSGMREPCPPDHTIPHLRRT